MGFPPWSCGPLLHRGGGEAEALPFGQHEDSNPVFDIICFANKKIIKRIGKIVKETRGGIKMQEIIISADSHVMEPPDLWAKGVTAPFRDKAPRFPEHKVGEGFQKHPGGQDPHCRIQEMESLKNSTKSTRFAAIGQCIC